MEEDQDILVLLQKEIACLKEKAAAADKALTVAHDHYKIDASHVDERLKSANHFKELMLVKDGTYVTRDKFEIVVSFQNKVLGFGVAIPIIISIITLIRH